ncbi:HAD family hydrolase [Aquabacterium sp.]|uniref:HAD family hydrolase n=1 Tax=Aquabacterium sp. TaxID=1872578 RepID=UPI002B9858BA|nr:HAD-IB family hydrolase [Aquabacterium sp.]HSW06947.1 HAD-IB family hydrolase [Aquabacterium sp.]
MRLTLFDLDHTLLDGDSDVLWCEFLMDQGVLERAAFAERNAAMERDYQTGTVSAEDFCAFYVSTLSGRSRAAWQPLRRRFLDEVIAPRISVAAHVLVQKHSGAGELVVMTTATNRFITELTAAHLGIAHLIATECETSADGFSGRPSGTLNMREGKVTRLHDWLAVRRIDLHECDSTLYSDSINDLPLLCAVRKPVAVDPDARLAAEAAERGWPVISLRRPTPAARLG